MKKAGFTITELLMAGVIFVGLLTAMTAMFVDSKDIHERQQVFSEKQDGRSSVFSMLEYEISLAGYRGTDLNEFDSRDFGNLPTINIDSSEGSENYSDQITVRYYEDRWTNEETELVETMFLVQGGDLIRLDLSKDGWNDAAQVISSNINYMKVIHYYDLDGTEFQIAPQSTENLGGIGIELGFLDDEPRELVIGFSNKQKE